MNANLFSRTPPRYWGYLSLLLWGSVAFFLLRSDPYNLDEGAAKSLLLIWSIADQVASSVVTFGAPDFRILLYIPVGFLWTGSVLAAKVFTLLLTAIAAWLLYSWKQRNSDSEIALFATGLLIISPLTLTQIDSLSPSIYLLLTFALGAWLNKEYRAAPISFGGWYFAQLFISALSVSLHPAGLAYPLALLWSWHKEPLDLKQQKYFFIGIGFAVLSTLVIRMGWHDLDWFQNPIRSLTSIMLDTAPNNEMATSRWILGTVIALTLTIVILKQLRSLWLDFTGRILLIGLILGFTTCDPAWAMIALCIILYFGFSLILPQQHTVVGGFVRQRGVALIFIFLLSTFFMQADKSHYLARQSGNLPDQDQLIRALAEEVEAARRIAEETDAAPASQLRVASEWPSRTMIACRCDTLPLPPAAKDSQAQLSMMHSITHMLFNPQLPANLSLARNLAVLGGDAVETVELLPGGVLLHFKNNSSNSSGK